jgi:hypothetical protein
MTIYCHGRRILFSLMFLSISQFALTCGFFCGIEGMARVQSLMRITRSLVNDDDWSGNERTERRHVRRVERTTTQSSVGRSTIRRVELERQDIDERARYADTPFFDSTAALAGENTQLLGERQDEHHTQDPEGIRFILPDGTRQSQPPSKIASPRTHFEFSQPPGSLPHH